MWLLALILCVIWTMFGLAALLSGWNSRSGKVVFVSLVTSTALTLFYFAYQARWS